MITSTNELNTLFPNINTKETIMADKTEKEFREWLFQGVVGIADERKRAEFAALLMPFFSATPGPGGILNGPADELEDNTSEPLEFPGNVIDERTRHHRTGSAAPRPALRRSIKPSIPPGLRAPRADAVTAVVAKGWDGDLGVMAREAYGKNSPHNRRKARSMVHSLKGRGRIEMKDGAWRVVSKS